MEHELKTALEAAGSKRKTLDADAWQATVGAYVSAAAEFVCVTCIKVGILVLANPGNPGPVSDLRDSRSEASSDEVFANLFW